MRHLNGMVRVPSKIPTYPKDHVLIGDEEEELENAEKLWDEYHQREALICAQIFAKIPDSPLIEVWKLTAAKQVWDAICMKHENRALTVKVDIRRQMYEMNYNDESNVRTHLETLMRMQV